jgi:PAS domain S-box-containing protein
MMTPLWRLSEAMSRGASGLARGEVTASGPAEIARLALRFNALAASVHDEIADRTHAETQARISEQNYRLLFAGNPQPLFVYDLDTLAFLEVNEAAIRRYGYSREEFLSQTVDAIVAPDQLPFLSSMKDSPDLHLSGPRTHRSKDGGLIEVLLNSSRIEYDGHHAQLVVVDDLTAQRKLEGQLQQSQRLDTVGQLAGGIAHDFNNLLAVILNYADFVAEALPEGDLRRDVEEIQHAAVRAADLTRQLLIFARRELTNPQVLDLNLVIGGVEKLLRRTIGEDVELVLKLAKDLPCVRADPGQMEQVFLNLTLNARDAMHGGGQLVVETTAIDLDSGYYAGSPDLVAGRYVRLSVSDTGNGMSKEVAARAFEPFFTTKPAGRGTGLGLATVYGIVIQAGGNIDIYSEPGTGTRVSIQLPAVDEPATPTVRSDAAALRTGDGRTVLLVEDESAVLQAAVRILGGHGYTVHATSAPSDAIAVLSDPAAQVDVLVTDMVMPGVSGVELARRAQELRPGLPVLYMSGYSPELAAHRGTLPAGSNIMRKPFTRRDLLKAIGDTLDAAQRDG